MTEIRVPEEIGAEPQQVWPNVGDKILYTRPYVDGEGTAWQTRRTVPSVVIGVLHGDDENPPRAHAITLTAPDEWADIDEWYSMLDSIRVVERAAYTTAGRHEAGILAAVSYMRQVLMSTGAVTLAQVDKYAESFTRTVVGAYLSAVDGE